MQTELKIQNIDALMLALVSSGLELLLASPRNQDPRRLVSHRCRVYSQNGEDGAIAEIFRRIGTSNRFFVEIGAGNGEENNTRFLLEQGWCGVWAECDAANVEHIRAAYRDELASGRLVLIDQPVTAENVKSLMGAVHVPVDLDLLSIDIDMNTSHVWRALNWCPRVAVIEYNAAIPPSVDWEVPYDPAAVWDGTTRYGASLKCLETIGLVRGLSLVGCELSGVNAYFVRAEDSMDFAAPFTAENHFEPARFLPPVGMPAQPRRLDAALEALNLRIA